MQGACRLGASREVELRMLEKPEEIPGGLGSRQVPLYKAPLDKTIGVEGFWKSSGSAQEPRSNIVHELLFQSCHGPASHQLLCDWPP